MVIQPTRSNSQRRRHGKLGIASFAIALTVLTTALVAAAGAGLLVWLGANNPLSDKVMQYGAIGIFLSAWLAGMLGIGGLNQKHSKKLFSVLGICTAATILVLLAAALVVALARSAS